MVLPIWLALMPYRSRRVAANGWRCSWWSRARAIIFPDELVEFLEDFEVFVGHVDHRGGWLCEEFLGVFLSCDFFDEAGELVDAGDVAFADFVDVFEADAQWQVDDGAVGETAVEVVVADGVLAFRGLGDLLERGFFLFGRPAVEVDFGDAGGFGLGCHVGCLSVVVDGVSGLVGVARSDPTALRATIAKRLLPR